MLKSFKNGKWDFNVQNIKKNYPILSKWEPSEPWFGNILFISGGRSLYIQECYYNNIYRQFPKAYICTIENAGHWVHIEKLDNILDIIDDFL